MKISNRFPSIHGQEPAEKEMPVEKYKGSKSLAEGSKIKSRVDKYEGPDSAQKQILQLPENAIPDVVRDRGLDPSQLMGHLRTFLNQNEESKESKADSPANQYKGPDSLHLPEIASKVDPYKGPDSLKRPEIESEVNKYKGPKSLPGDPKIESQVDPYKGPDSVPRLILTSAPLDSIPDVPSEIGGFVNRALNRKEESVDFRPSETASEVDKYKGPGSLQNSLRRIQIENQLNKGKK